MVLFSKRMTCLAEGVESRRAVAVVPIKSELTRGMFWMVP